MSSGYRPVTGQSLPPDECETAAGDTYTIDELAEHAGCTVKQVDHWTRAGLLHPAGRENATNGVRRRWDAGEAEVARRMMLLLDVGLSTRLAHDVARHRGAGPYRVRGVAIALDVDQGPQVASATDREILRRPARQHLANALQTLLDEATAAAQLLDEYAPVVDCSLLPVPAYERHDVGTLVLLAQLITGRDGILATPAESQEIPGPETGTGE